MAAVRNAELGSARLCAALIVGGVEHEVAALSPAAHRAHDAVAHHLVPPDPGGLASYRLVDLAGLGRVVVGEDRLDQHGRGLARASCRRRPRAARIRAIPRCSRWSNSSRSGDVRCAGSGCCSRGIRRLPTGPGDSTGRSVPRWAGRRSAACRPSRATRSRRRPTRTACR